MSDRIIDARNRFRKPAGQQDQAEVAAQWTERRQRQQEEAKGLRATLGSIPRLEVADRKIIVRNLGRAIERKQGENPKQLCSLLFRRLFGEDGGLSKEKKRKRYIRFDGEPLNDHGPGEEYAASGPEFLRLIDGLAELLDQQSPADQAKGQMLLFVCDGTSFYGPAHPRLVQGQDLTQKFKVTMDAVIDRFARDTDIIAYLEEVQHYTIKTCPSTRDEFSADALANLHRELLPIDRFEHMTAEEEERLFGEARSYGFGYGEYCRLRLGGFDIRAEAPAILYPEIRLARIYWPRQILCLPASVPTTALEEIWTRPLTDAELSAALAAIKDDDRLEGLVNRERLAISRWRDKRESELWRQALRDAGLDPDNIDWHSFEDDLDGSACRGAKWHTFWNSVNVDLHVIADGKPEALHFGLSFAGRQFSHWAHDIKKLVHPRDDDRPGAKIDDDCFTITHPDMGVFSWLPVGKRSHICRGFEIYSESEDGSDLEEEYFEEPLPGFLQELFRKPLWPLQEKEAWEFLTLRMADWLASSHEFGSDQRRNDELPRLRPLFDAPQGWTPAPDGSLASAILRSLAYGTGEERLDNKIMAAINNRVGCLAEMKDRLSRQFEEALAQHGYND